MMTHREAYQRVSCYRGLTLVSRTRHNKRQYGIRSEYWDNTRPWQQRVTWRDDIEDAVLDCGRIKQG